MTPDIPLCARMACLFEATARKPGNVHRLAEFDDSGYLDFLISAVAIGDLLDPTRIAARGVGGTVLDAIEATQRVVYTNTNLGILLLLTPLAAVWPHQSLREGVRDILQALTIDDARHVYQAIRLANPGGLGSVSEQDVAREPTATLLDAMRLAAERDAVARQYAMDYADVLEIGLPALAAYLETGRNLETAIIAAHMTLMAACPDTLIARKRGLSTALDSADRARVVLSVGWPETETGRRAYSSFDRWLRADGHARNPGATADLVAATLFAALRDNLIPLPNDWQTAFPVDNPDIPGSS